MYRRTTIAAATIALALLGGGSALAANAGLFGGDRPDGAGTLPAVSTLDPGPAGDEAGPPTPSPTDAVPSSTAGHEDAEDTERRGDDEAGEGAEVEDDD